MASMRVGGTSGALDTSARRANNNNDGIHPPRTAEPMMSDPFILRALHSHLRSSLFNKTCADIQICAFQRTYALHRVFLIQSTFFHSLLNGDFYEAQSWQTESTPASSSSSSQQNRLESASSSGPAERSSSANVVQLHFDDPNITRAAFEFCIASLYGSAPQLVLPTWASPSPTHPLTEHFESHRLFQLAKQSTILANEANEDASESDCMEDDVKTNLDDDEKEDNTSMAKGPQQPATPRFLLSLLATAAYLGIPSVTAQAITLILSSITPFTVSHYLRFALGFGIHGAFEAKERRSSNSSSFWDWELEGPAWGLAGLASSPKRKDATVQGIDELVQRTTSIGLHDDAAQSPSSERSARDQSSFAEDGYVNESFETESQGFYYGTQWDKIGEACSCWLLRWGADVLLAEEQLLLIAGEAGQPNFLEAFILPRDTLPVEQSLTFNDCPAQIRTIFPPPYPTVWCHPKRGGIPANWVRAIISSDSFWIREEWDRYEVARKVVSMRRSFSRRAHWDEKGYASGDDEDGRHDKQVGDQDDSLSESRGSVNSQQSTIRFASTMEEERDEAEYERLFAEGIYYTHLSFARLSSISNDICPHTGHAYAPINVLQGSLWTQSELKNIILSKDPHRGEDAVLDTRTRNDEDDEETRGMPEERRESKDMDSERELGLVSSSNEFAKVLAGVNKRGRPSFAQNNAEDHRPTTLGGVTPLMQPFSFTAGSKHSSAMEALLSKRFFAVPVDDTIRMGENLASLSAAATAAQQNQHSAGGANAPPRQANVFASQEEAPSGIASAVNGHTLSLTHENKRTASVRFFGLENAVQRGKEVGRLVGGQGKAATSVRPNGGELNVEDTSIWTQDAADDTTSGEEQGAAGNAYVPRDWSGFEPMRIGVEFYDVDRLSEKQRLYSPSFFYAGSVWNLYVQTVKKPKGLQLGIYLHRQNCNDNLPSPSVPSRSLEQLHGAPPRIPASMSDFAVAEIDDSFTTTNSSTTNVPPADATGEPHTPRRNGSRPNSGPNPAAFAHGGLLYSNSPISSRLQTPLHRSTYTTNGTARLTPRAVQTSSQAATAVPVSSDADAQGGGGGGGVPSGTRQATNAPAGGAPNGGTIVGLSASESSMQSLEIPYYDHRRVLRAYFSIHCPSPMGTSLTKFSSRPDNFTLSQSWGWKSSSLLGAVFLEDGQLGTARSQVSQTFRCVVTMGVV